MSSLEDSNATDTNDSTLVVIADTTTPTRRATVTASNELVVALPSGAATAANQTTEITALQIIDDLPHSQNAALVKGVPMMGQLDDVSTTAATENNVAVPRITTQRALHVNLRDASGNEFGGSSNPFITTAVVSDGVKATYSDALTFTVAATATDICTIYGSGTKTIKVRSITIGCTNTLNTNVLVLVKKRSTANTGGTSTTGSPVSHDSNNAAATASVKFYTANPSALGTQVGDNVAAIYVFSPLLGSTNPIQMNSVTFGSGLLQPMTLRGTGEGLTVNLNGALVTGVTIFSVRVEWTEET